jgi:hypothetical protein
MAVSTTSGEQGIPSIGPEHPTGWRRHIAMGRARATRVGSLALLSGETLNRAGQTTKSGQVRSRTNFTVPISPWIGA